MLCKQILVPLVQLNSFLIRNQVQFDCECEDGDISRTDIVLKNTKQINKETNYLCLLRSKKIVSFCWECKKLFLSGRKTIAHPRSQLSNGVPKICITVMLQRILVWSAVHRLIAKKCLRQIWSHHLVRT